MSDTLYEQLKAIAADYTVEQVENATKQQVANLLGVDVDDPVWSGANRGRFVNLKGRLVRELKRRDDESHRLALEQYLTDGQRQWFRTNYPDAVFVHKRGKYPVIEIHYKGLAPVEEIE